MTVVWWIAAITWEALTVGGTIGLLMLAADPGIDRPIIVRLGPAAGSLACFAGIWALGVPLISLALGQGFGY